MTATIHEPAAAPTARAAQGVITSVTHLDHLLGGHPDALRSIYEHGRAASPEDLVGSWWGRLLSVDPAREVASLMRPIAQTLRGGAPFWTGKTFFADATGVNHLLGGKAVRLGVETGLSELDGAPTTIFRYDVPQHKNPWPIRNVYDELRLVAPSIAIGPMLFSIKAGGPRSVVLWFGLQRDS